MNKTLQLYDMMHKTFGPQGWWPLSKGKHKTKYHSGPPTNHHDKWEIIIGAVLTQNTSWNNVEKAIENLNNAKLIKIDKIIKTPVSRIAKLIRPAGYYNQKAERLKIVAKYFSKHFKDESIPSREELLDVKGIGQETADSILLYAFERPYFVVDAYTRRIFSRLGLIKHDASYDEIQALFMKELTKTKNKVDMFKEYHALIVEQAKKNCRNRPLCRDCLLAKMCEKMV